MSTATSRTRTSDKLSRINGLTYQMELNIDTTEKVAKLYLSFSFSCERTSLLNYVE
jgi:hypothetical protein